MAVKDKLDQAWNTNLMEDATFEFRAITEDAYNLISQMVSKIDEIVGRNVFTNVDPELKIEGQAIRTILNSAKVSLDAHQTFLKWRQS